MTVAGATRQRARRSRPNSFRVIRAIAANDLSIWTKRPVVIFSTLVPSIMYVLVIYFLSVTVGKPPVALVNQDVGQRGARLQQIMETSGDFSLSVLKADAARAELASMKVAAIVTIASSFDDSSAAVGGSVRMEMNNVNQDIQDDLRRSLAASLRTFHQRSQAAPLPVVIAESDSYGTDVSLAQFRIVPGLVLIMTIAGVVNAGLAMCQEFERRTIKELSLAPIRRRDLVLGKIAGGWLTTAVVGAALVGVGIVSGLLRPAVPYWIPTIFMALLVGLSGSALGVATGAVVRRYQLVTSISVAISLYLFFLSGGISVAAFLPTVMQTAAHFVPLYYGIQALEEAVFDGSVAHFLRDSAIMTAFAVASTLVAIVSVRRPLAG